MFNDTNDAVETWSSLFLDVVNKHLPLKQHRVKRKQQLKWITGEIIDAIKTRDRYKYINDDTRYRIWRNKVCSMIMRSKKHQYSDFFVSFFIFILHVINYVFISTCIFICI